MKKLLSLLLVVTIISTYSCKKDDEKEKDKEEDPKTECMVTKVQYTDPNDANENESSTYTNDDVKGLIQSYDRTLIGSSGPVTYTYTYIYEDDTKGLIDRIEIYSGTDLLAKIEYTNVNDKISKRELVLQTTSGGWFSPNAWTISYTYNANGKVDQLRIEDNDLWTNPPVPTDETAVYTYTGDNNSNVKWYNTSDINGTALTELEYTYDTKHRVFSKVKTLEYPNNNVNNAVGLIYHKYGAAPSSATRVYTYTYNSKDMPTQKNVADDRGTAISSSQYTYSNCGN